MFVSLSIIWRGALISHANFISVSTCDDFIVITCNTPIYILEREKKSIFIKDSWVVHCYITTNSKFSAFLLILYIISSL